MKKYIPLLIIISLLLNACVSNGDRNKIVTVKNIDEQGKIEDTFNKKQECLKHTELLKNKAGEISKEYPSLGTSSFEQVFYSPKYNNCLWVRVTETEERTLNRDNIILPYTISHRGLYEIGNDSGSSRPIDSCYKSAIHLDERINYNSCDEFDQTIKELKGE